MSSSLIQINLGEVRIGKRVEKCEDLVVLLVYPRSDNTDTTVGVAWSDGE